MYESTTDLTLRQTHILDNHAKDSYWLFDITYGGSTYYWSDFSSKTYGGNTYTFKIRSWSGVDIMLGLDNVVTPGNVWIDIDNAGNTLTPADIQDSKLTIRLVMSANLAVQPSAGDATIETGVTLDNSHSDVQEDQIRAWRFECTDVAPTGLQSLRARFQPFHKKYVKQEWPVGRLLHDEFPDNTDMKDTFCVPQIYGTAYIPVRSVYSSTKRYYLLGAAGATYTVSEVRAPKERGSKTYDSGTYTFSDDQTITGRSTTQYKAAEFLCDDSDDDGTNDANILFWTGSRYLDALCKYTDSTTVSMTAPGNVIEHFLEALGAPSAEINDTAKAAFNTTCASRGISFNGGFYFKQPAEKILADMLRQSDADLVVRDTLILRERDNTSKFTITPGMMLVDSKDNDTFKCNPVTREDKKDSVMVAYRPTGEPCDSLLKIVVPADTTTALPDYNIYEMPLVHDSQVVQKLGTLAAQRRLNGKYAISFIADPKILQLEVGDVFTLASVDHGGPVDVLITRMTIGPMLDIKITGTVHTVALKNWSDLSPSAVTVATDDSTNVYTPVYQGGIDAENPYTGENVITKTLLVGTGGTFETNIDPSSNGGLEITQTSLTGYNTSGDVRFQTIYSGTDQGDVIIGDYTGDKGIFWDQSDTKLYIKTDAAGGVEIGGGGDITLDGADADPGIINFEGSSYTIEIGGDADGDRFLIKPNTNNVTDFYIGTYNWWYNNKLFKEIQTHSQSTSTFQAGAKPVGIAGASCGIILDPSNERVMISAQHTSAGLIRGNFTVNYDNLLLNPYLGGYIGIWTRQNDSIADDGTLDLPDATAGMIFVSCNAEGGGWNIQSDGTVSKLFGSANTADTDSDTDLCVYNSAGTQATIKNRLGTTGEIRVFYFYY